MPSERALLRCDFRREWTARRFSRRSAHATCSSHCERDRSGFRPTFTVRRTRCSRQPWSQRSVSPRCVSRRPALSQRRNGQDVRQVRLKNTFVDRGSSIDHCGLMAPEPGSIRVVRHLRYFFYSFSSSFLDSASSFLCSSVISGYASLIDFRLLAITSAMTMRVNHLWSAGTIYQGAHSVLVWFTISSYAFM